MSKVCCWFFASASRFPKLYFKDERPSIRRSSVDLLGDHSELNDSQMSSLKGALSAKDYFLVQGPPGSGKTQYISSLINELVLSGENVLVSAFTNSAVDNCLERYRRDHGDSGVIRVSGSKVGSFDDLENSKVVGVTAFGAIYNKLFEVKSFDTIIIEESSQLLDEHIMFILSKGKRVVLVGDHMQLPPIVSQTVGLDGSYDYSVSIFERLFKMCVSKGYSGAYGTLKKQYRMSPKISEYISSTFYDGILESMVIPNDGDGIYFKGFTDREVSKSNKREARACYKLVSSLLDEGFSVDDIGIVAPFRAQVALIKNKLGGLSVQVDTVEKYQGREKEVIIFSSTARSAAILSMMSPKSGLEDKKLNVAVSRAKRRLYLLGSEGVLSSRPEYKKLIDSATIVL